MKRGGPGGGSANWPKTLLKVVVITAIVLAIWFLIAHFLDDPLFKYWKVKQDTKVGKRAVKEVFDFFQFAYVRIVPTFLLIWACLIAGPKSEKWRFVVQVLLGIVCVAVPTWFCKILLPRCRPRWFEGETWIDSFSKIPYKLTQFKDQIADNHSQSFFSGDAAVSFAVAAILAYHFAQYRLIFYILAIGCAVSRFTSLRHWPSDIFLGAVVGYIVGRAVLVLTGDIRTNQ